MLSRLIGIVTQARENLKPRWDGREWPSPIRSQHPRRLLHAALPWHHALGVLRHDEILKTALQRLNAECAECRCRWAG